MSSADVDGAKAHNQSPGLLIRLRHMSDTLPRKAAQIAMFLADNADRVVGMTITEVAESVGVAEGSVVSLCRRLGASGFQDFKIKLAQNLVEPMRWIQEDLREGDDFETVARHVFHAHTVSIEETLRLLSPAALAKAIEMLLSARRIEIYGVGSSAPIAQDLAYRLLRLGLNANAFVDSHVQAVAAAMAGPDVTAITVSHTGATIETVTATRLAKEAGARVIGITCLGKPPLARYCDVLLHTVARETQYRPEAMSSRVAQLAIIDTLVSCCAMSDPEHALANLNRSGAILAEKRF